jgi:hypothetical protein
MDTSVYILMSFVFPFVSLPYSMNHYLNDPYSQTMLNTPRTVPTFYSQPNLGNVLASENKSWQQ